MSPVQSGIITTSYCLYFERSKRPGSTGEACIWCTYPRSLSGTAGDRIDGEDHGLLPLPINRDCVRPQLSASQQIPPAAKIRSNFSKEASIFGETPRSAGRTKNENSLLPCPHAVGEPGIICVHLRSCRDLLLPSKSKPSLHSNSCDAPLKQVLVLDMHGISCGSSNRYCLFG